MAFTKTVSSLEEMHYKLIKDGEKVVKLTEYQLKKMRMFFTVFIKTKLPEDAPDIHNDTFRVEIFDGSKCENNFSKASELLSTEEDLDNTEFMISDEVSDCSNLSSPEDSDEG